MCAGGEHSCYRCDGAHAESMGDDDPFSRAVFVVVASPVTVAELVTI